MVAMLIEVAEEFKEFGAAVLEVVSKTQEAVRRTSGGKALDYGEVEDVIAEGVSRIERAAHQVILQALDVDRPAVLIDGKRHTQVGRSEATYYTMAGPVVVERSLYRDCEVRNGKVVDAVSLRAGVVADGWLPHAARAMAHDVQMTTSRDAEAGARERKRLEYSRSSYERVAHAVGELYVAAYADIEDALIEGYDIPSEARSVSVSLDRVSVAMEEPRPRPRGRPRKGAAKRPVWRNFRMAYCGTVTLHNAEGEALHTIRYGPMPKGDEKGLVQSMAADVAVLLRKRPELKIQLLCDGAPEMWNLLAERFTEERLGVEIHKLVDFYHVLEKLGAAAGMLYGREAAGKALQRWRLTFLNHATAAAQILGVLRISGMEYVTDGDQRPIHDAITYLANHADSLDYATARQLGLPIGSGNVEATCKSLFNVRMKRSGARWKATTAEHIVQLRAVALSDRWGDAMNLMLRRLRKPVRVAA